MNHTFKRTPNSGGIINTDRLAFQNIKQARELLNIKEQALEERLQMLERRILLLEELLN